MVVELEFLLGGEMAAHSEVGRFLDQVALEGDAQRLVLHLARLQGHEGVTAEDAGAYGGPLGFARGVVEIHLVHGADLRPPAVDGPAADQAPRIDIGLHGPSSWSRLLHQSPWSP
ncbi:hypothetical protein GCM10027091_80590 [Streptomyces daliensis]